MDRVTGLSDHESAPLPTEPVVLPSPPVMLRFSCAVDTPSGCSCQFCQLSHHKWPRLPHPTPATVYTFYLAREEEEAMLVVIVLTLTLTARLVLGKLTLRLLDGRELGRQCSHFLNQNT